MDNPQYYKYEFEYNNKKYSFKPYYKWITLNTCYLKDLYNSDFLVLNLIING